MWFKDTSGEKSASFTIAIIASLVTAGAFVASLFGCVAHPVSGTDCAAFVGPFLACYSWRRSTRSGAPVE